MQLPKFFKRKDTAKKWTCGASESLLISCESLSLYACAHRVAYCVVSSAITSSKRGSLLLPKTHFYQIVPTFPYFSLSFVHDVVTQHRLCGFPPFYHDNIPLLFESIMKADYDYPNEYWEHISDDGTNM